jgi:hypothetical protein
MGVAEKQLKVVVVGDAFVGKTRHLQIVYLLFYFHVYCSLLFAYTQNTFEGNYSTTVFNNWAVTVTVNQRQCTVNLFDTAGQVSNIFPNGDDYGLQGGFGEYPMSQLPADRCLPIVFLPDR